MGHKKTQALRLKLWPKRKLPSGVMVRSLIDKPFPQWRPVHKKGGTFDERNR